MDLFLSVPVLFPVLENHTNDAPSPWQQHSGSSIYFYPFYSGGWIQLADFQHSQNQHHFRSQRYQHSQICPPLRGLSPSLFPNLVLRMFGGPRLLAFACMGLKFRSFCWNVKDKDITRRLWDLGTFSLHVNDSQDCIYMPDIFPAFKQRAYMCLKLRMSTIKSLSSPLTQWMLTPSTTSQKESLFTFTDSLQVMSTLLPKCLLISISNLQP